ncbi:MAG: hypothetical protein ACTSXT_08575 [Candidatus Helarchaeota archaeon]
MGKKLTATIGIILILVIPMLFVMIPSINSLSGIVNLYSSLTSSDASQKISLSTFAFVDATDETYTLRLDLGINNSGSNSPLLFPQLNMTLKYGPDTLGQGWVSDPIVVPPNQYKVVPIYMIMKRGDTFNKFFMSILAGGLNIALSDVEIYVFLNTFGGIGPVSSIVIPLSSLAMPSMSLSGDSSAYFPVLLKASRDPVMANQPINFYATVQDKKGGGVKSVILSYSINDGAWTNVSMTGLPTKPIVGGPNTALGWIFTNSFPNYPNSSIPTLWSNATVNYSLPGCSVGTNIKYRFYVIDTIGNTVIGPSTTPSIISGSDNIDISNKYFSFTVASSNPSFSATWKSAVGLCGGGEDDIMANILDDLSSAGIDIVNMMMEASPSLQVMGNLNISALVSSDPNIQKAALDELMDAISPLILYLESKNVNGFEVLDQLMGMSGGSPMFASVGYPGDVNWSFNANSSIAFDMLGEAGISLIDLMNVLEVNISQVIDSIATNLYRPTIKDKNPIEGLLILSNQTLSNTTKKQNFINYLYQKDLIYQEFPNVHVYYHNVSVNTWMNYTLPANDTVEADVNLTGAINDTIYFAAPMVSGLLSTAKSPITKMTALYFNMSTNVNNGSYQYKWEFYNSSASAWDPIPIILDETNNLSQSGKIIFGRYINGMTPRTQTIGTSNVGESYWVRLNIINKISSINISANFVRMCDELVPYYLESQNKDFLGRPLTNFDPDLIHNITDLMTYANSTNGYIGKVVKIFEFKNLTYDDVVTQFGGSFLETPMGVSVNELMQVNPILLGIIIYGMTGFMIYIASRSPTFEYPRQKVKKWFDSITMKPGKKEEYSKSYADLKIDTTNEGA